MNAPRSTHEYASTGQEPRRFRLLKPLAEAGTEIEQTTLSSSTYHQPMCELAVAIGNDHTATILVPLDTCTANPDWFEELTA